MRSPFRQRLGRSPARGQGPHRDALGGPEARPGATGLHLADDQRGTVAQHEVELAEARTQAPREMRPALAQEAALGPALAGQREQGLVDAGAEQQAARRDVQQQALDEVRGGGPARAAARQAWLGTLSPVAGAVGSLSMFWIAWRANFSRTLSATCSVTTSSVSCTTVP